MTKKEDLRILKTKNGLYRAILELMKTKQFEEIKVSEICEYALINRSTFYDHFNDKYELLQSLINDMKIELEQSMVLDRKTNSIKEYYNELLKILLEHIDHNKNIYSAVVKINSNSIAKDMLMETIITSATKEIEENYHNIASVPTKTFVMFYVSGYINVIMDSLREPNGFNKDKIYEMLSTLTPSEDFYQ